jgi:hypothetical protein
MTPDANRRDAEETAQLALGREVMEDAGCANMMRHGRPLTNVEMMAAVSWALRQRPWPPETNEEDKQCCNQNREFTAT